MPALLTRNIVLPTGRTSLRLEPVLWDGLAEAARREGLTEGELVALAEAARPQGQAGRTSVVRTFLITYFRQAATAAGHQAAGHGALARNDEPTSSKRGSLRPLRRVASSRP